jgi:L-malate glycosyltransferase
MRILILANARAVHTQRWASALGERGHHVVVASIRSAKIKNATVITRAVGPANSPSPIWTFLSYLRLLFSIRRIRRAVKSDIVNAHFCITHGMIAALAFLRPRVVNIWGSDVIWDGKGTMPPWRRLLIRLSLKHADAIVSTSRYMRDAIRPVIRGRPPVHVVPFGVEVQIFAPDQQPHRVDTVRSVRVGFIKTLSEKYAPDVFLKAAALAMKHQADLEFVVAGHGPLRECMEKLASDLSLSDRVSFVGFMPHEAVPALMRSLDIVVNCSRWDSETFGVVICEASACGLPVIATDVGGVREVLVDGETGILVPRDNVDALADAICALAADTCRRVALGSAGRQFICGHYAWQESVEKMLEVLKDSVETHGRIRRSGSVDAGVKRQGAR